MPKKKSASKRTEEAMLVETMRGALQTRNTGMLREIMEETMNLAGGTRCFAKLLWDAYTSSDAGPLLRSRILDVWMRALMVTQPKGDPDNDLGALSAEDIDREMKELIGAVRSEQNAADAAQEDHHLEGDDDSAEEE